MDYGSIIFVELASSFYNKETLLSFYEQTKVGNAFKSDQACSFSAQPRRKIKLLTLQEFHAANFLIELRIVTQSLLDFPINFKDDHAFENGVTFSNFTALQKALGQVYLRCFTIVTICTKF